MIDSSAQHAAYWRYEYDVSRRFMIPLLNSWGVPVAGSSVLDVGCGEGGGLCAFQDAGARCCGFDIDRVRVDLAEKLREEREIPFIVGDMYAAEPPFPGKRFDLVMLHDVFEHLEQKDATLRKLREYLDDRGTILITFPPYYSAYGAHQQHLRTPIARLPFFHLVPGAIHRLLPRLTKEAPSVVQEIQKLSRLKMGMRRFEAIARRNSLLVRARRAYLISPNHIRFGLRPLSAGLVSRIPLVGELVCTGVVYLLAADNA